ncbi:MAG: TRAP transporter fused permease subunit [Deltaproteobacteria bacterium]|nr:TRAP transporter fused permease subunit [Deltaproteobacteria bacterium]MBT4637433.1 TRAP transporter fused permease subunit [Deltaproteobacteria bacterium]MBT7710558.1 TRAP transporter fused permease subunit [Deltaproteobacteria bacterium]
MSNRSKYTSSTTGILFALVATAIVVYHMASVVSLIQGPLEHQIVHLGMMFLVVFGAALLSRPGLAGNIAWSLCLIVGLGVIVYMRVNYEYLLDVVGFPENPDMVVGVLLVIVVLVGTWMSWGNVFPGLAVIMIAYFFWGHHLPDPLYHPKIDFDLGISNLGIGFSGVFGSLLSVMANFGFNLVIFGALLELAGANKFFLEVGKAAGRKLAGGPAQTAVIGSSLVGMVSGGAVGNVLITGAFTIPMMRKVGFKPETAGAIEATASTGSQLMPPIMGIAAFMMAGFLNKDFSEIMLAGVVPSILFYITVAFGVQLIAMDQGIKAEKVEIDRQVLRQQAPLFLIPLGVLITLLLMNFTAGLSSFVVNCLLLVMVYLRKSTRPSVKGLLETMAKGAVMAGKISFAVATVGILQQVFINTGLAQKLAVIVEMISFGILPLILFFTMILSLFIGLGLPAAAAYALVAILIAPGLVQMGIEPIRVHFFAFYFAIISAVTPPVALGALAASSIAGSSYWKTGVEAFKLSIPNFIMPFLIIYNPVFLLRSETTLGYGILSVFAAICALLLLTSVIYKYMRTSLLGWEQAGFLLASIFFFAFCFSMEGGWLIAGLVLSSIVLGWHFRRAANLDLNASVAV